jgi:hypothetical protein
MGVGQTYRLSVAARAAQTSPSKTRRLIDSVSPLRGNDVKAAGSGNRVGLSRNRVLQIATIEVLVKSGVSLSNAAKGALIFSDCGSAGREPGELFKHGKTILFIGPEGPTVKNIPFNATLTDISDVCIIAVDINSVVDAVDAILKETTK